MLSLAALSQFIKAIQDRQGMVNLVRRQYLHKIPLSLPGVRSFPMSCDMRRWAYKASLAHGANLTESTMGCRVTTRSCEKAQSQPEVVLQADTLSTKSAELMQESDEACLLFVRVPLPYLDVWYWVKILDLATVLSNSSSSW